MMDLPEINEWMWHRRIDRRAAIGAAGATEATTGTDDARSASALARGAWLGYMSMQPHCTWAAVTRLLPAGSQSVAVTDADASVANATNVFWSRPSIKQQQWQQQHPSLASRWLMADGWWMMLGSLIEIRCIMLWVERTVQNAWICPCATLTALDCQQNCFAAKPTVSCCLLAGLFLACKFAYFFIFYSGWLLLLLLLLAYGTSFWSECNCCTAGR